MYEIAIIGAGPAGASAAIFTSRAGKKTIMFEGNKGMTKRAWFQNHYGIKEIGGPDLVQVGKEQALQFGTEIKDEVVTNVTAIEGGFKVETESSSYEAQHVLLATGALAELAEAIGVTTKPATEPRIKTIVDTDNSGRTNIAGIWAAGTVAGVSVHSIITAGDGAKVAINIISELNGERWVDHDLLK